MRSIEEQRIALECLAFAIQHSAHMGDAAYVLSIAEAFLVFVTGRDRDDAKHTLDAVREIIG